LPSLISTAWLVAATGCATKFQPLQLSQLATASTAQLIASTRRVSVSVDVLWEEISDDTRLLVLLDLTANEDLLLDLRDSRLLYGSEREQAPIAAGIGEPENPLGVLALRLMDPLQLRAAQTTRVWVVFAGFDGPVPEIPVRMRVRIMPDVEVTLSEPGEEPLWQADPVRMTLSFGGIWMQGGGDRTNVAVALADERYDFGPLVLSYRVGMGVEFQHAGRTLCCSLPLAAELAVPLGHGNIVWSPYLGVEGSRFPSESTDTSARFWVGPALGLQIGFGPLRSRHGPFPITQPPSVLTRSNLRIGLTHWFGSNRSFPDFGVILSYSLAAGG